MSTVEEPAQSEHEIYKRQHDERGWAMFCHVAVLAAFIFPFGHIIGPLVVWLAKKEQYPLVDDQGKESVNFQITMTIFVVILLVVFIVGLLVSVAGDAGFPATLILSLGGMLLLGIINMIFVILAAIRSYHGERYRYPFSIRFIS